MITAKTETETPRRELNYLGVVGVEETLLKSTEDEQRY